MYLLTVSVFYALNIAPVEYQVTYPTDQECQIQAEYKSKFYDEEANQNRLIGYAIKCEERK